MIKNFLFILFLLFTTTLNSASLNMIGHKGNELNIDRVINIKMYDNYFEPNFVKIKKGETIKFLISNKGSLVHEYNIGTKEMHLEHQDEMQKLVDNEIIKGGEIDKLKMKIMSKKDHSLAHSHSNSVMLEPNQIGEIIWKFTKNVDLEMSCNVPGHYQSGMLGKIIIY